MVTNGALELAENTIEAQRSLQKGTIKRDYMASFCIQYAIDIANFDRISHVVSTKEACDIVSKYYEGSEEFKSVKLQYLQK